MMRERLYAQSGYDEEENYPRYTSGRRRRIYAANAKGTKDNATKYDEIT